MKADEVAKGVYQKLKFPVAFTDLYCDGLKDSLDYAGELGEIAFVGNHTKGVSIVVAGGTRFVAPDGTRFANRTAESEGYDKDKVMWDENNWFELISVKNGKSVEHLSFFEVGVEYDLDEAIRRAVEILEDPSYWSEEG